MIIMEEKLKAMVDSLKKGLDSKVENDIKISKEEEKQINEERDKKIEEANKQIEAANKMIEEANKEAEEKKAEVQNKVFLKYENMLKEMNGKTFQQEQPLENFDIPNMELNNEKQTDFQDTIDPEVKSDIESELFDKKEEQQEFTPVSEPSVSIDFENGASEESTTFDANVEETPAVENESQIETSEPIQVTAVEDGADVIAQLGSVEQEKTQEAAPKLEEETKENTEVNNEVVNAAPGTDVFVGSLPIEYAQVDNSQQEAVQETAPQVEEDVPQVEAPVQEQPVSNFERSSGFTGMIDSMDQGRTRVHTPNN